MSMKGIFASIERMSPSQLEEMPASLRKGGESPFQRREYLLFKGGNTSLLVLKEGTPPSIQRGNSLYTCDADSSLAVDVKTI